MLKYEKLIIIFRRDNMIKGEANISPRETQIEVKKVYITPDVLKTIEECGRTAYLSFDKITDESAESFIDMIVRRGHESVLEHAVLSVRVKGISRSCSHQLVRHRLVSYTQQSQRYVDEKNFSIIVPNSIKKDGEAYDNFLELMEQIKSFYSFLQKKGVPNQDARFVLPNATETQICVTTNLREWRHILELRGSPHAQWEIREMAIRVYEILKEECPIIVSDFELTDKRTLRKIRKIE